MIQHGLGLLISPENRWRAIGNLPESSMKSLALYPVLMAVLPAVAWYYGTTQIGWSIGEQADATKLTTQSAAVICVLFYLAMIASVAVIGYFIHWMAATYGAQSSIPKGVAISALAATPMFVAGLVGFYPIMWIDMLIGVTAVCWSVYLMYLGIPIVMNIPKERGFLFSSAVMAIALVILICLMVGSVILWDFGAAPAFTD